MGLTLNFGLYSTGKLLLVLIFLKDYKSMPEPNCDRPKNFFGKSVDMRPDLPEDYESLVTFVFKRNWRNWQTR